MNPKIQELIQKKTLTPKEKATLKSKLSKRTAMYIGDLIDAAEIVENVPLPEAHIELPHLYKGKKFFYYELLEEVWTEQSIIFFEGSFVYFTTHSKGKPTSTFLSLEGVVDHLLKHMARKDKTINKDREAISFRVNNILFKIQKLFTE